ncbi:MAG: rRNA maturation RNase YbeY [Planctomycetota bacterium]|jgi:probable rRNA maturation factor|uniref:rRNA maturation RNase YbeY n=1 Tax=uncultured Gimesia sp. TaxID=1678688 RepID=UPI0026199C0D|nr:rRNA maturation RNase YbeY [uncultured Gimesia sp.]
MNITDQFQIKIQNSQHHLAIDEALLQETACFVLQSEKVAQADISLAIIDNAAIRELNQQYLEHDYDTDVLSFLLECQLDTEKQDPDLRGAGKTIEGEIIVSAEMAVSMSESYQWSAANELLLYVIHGLLHLCGYDDLTEEEIQLMRIREQQIFDQRGLTIPRREE